MIQGRLIVGSDLGKPKPQARVNIVVRVPQSSFLGQIQELKIT